LDLYIARHGEAGKSLANARRNDERSLTTEGRREAERLGELASEMMLRFDEVASSPLPRARETAEAIVKLQKKVKLQLWDELRPEGNKSAALDRLSKIGHGSKVLLVGHEPYLTSLIGDLLGAKAAGIVLKKGGLARIHVTSFSPSPRGELRWLLSPRLVKRIS
jgi:phosphohistidine phosphatase